MGLFGRKKQDEPYYATIQEFLQSEPTESLMNYARELCKFERVIENGNVDSVYQLRIQDYYKVKIEDSWFGVVSLSRKVPKNIKHSAKPNALVAFQELEARGEDPNAAFIHGMMYEHGVCSATPKDAGEARRLYNIAEAQGSKLVNVRDFLADNRLEMPAQCWSDMGELLAFNLFPTRLKNHSMPEVRELYDTLSQRDIEDLKLAATLAMVYYQSIGYPFSIGMLGGQIILKTTNKSVWKESRPITDNFTPPPSKDEGYALWAKVHKMARMGNPYALATCNFWNIRFNV